MPNFQLHKGKYTTVGVSLTDYDGQPDLTTPIQVGQTGGNAFLIEPAGPRMVYVSVQPGLLISQTGTIVLNANIPATGSGAGSPDVQKIVQFQIDAIVPIDRRAADPVAPIAEQPLPHP